VNKDDNGNKLTKDTISSDDGALKSVLLIPTVVTVFLFFYILFVWSMRNSRHFSVTPVRRRYHAGGRYEGLPGNNGYQLEMGLRG
jgi:hypothetical protein